jgi:hypothetical protein
MCFVSWLCMSSRKAACGLAKAVHRLTKAWSSMRTCDVLLQTKGHGTQCLAPDFLQVVDQAVDIGCMRMGVCPLPSALNLLSTHGSTVEAWQRCGYAFEVNSRKLRYKIKCFPHELPERCKHRFEGVTKHGKWQQFSQSGKQASERGRTAAPHTIWAHSMIAIQRAH